MDFVQMEPDCGITRYLNKGFNQAVIPLSGREHFDAVRLCPDSSSYHSDRRKSLEVST